MDYQAVILAAGLGSRLHQHTKEKPKPLLRVNNYPIIDYQLSALANNNITNVIIVTGYKHKVLKKYLDNEWSKKVNISFVHNEVYSETNSAYSLYLAKEKINMEFYIHLNCDTIFSDVIISELLDSEHENQIVIDRSLSLENNMEQVRIDDSGRIIKMDNMYDYKAVGKAMGLAKINQNSLKRILKKINHYHKLKNYKSNYYGIIREMVSDCEFYSFESQKGLIVDINNEAELNAAEKKIKDFRS